MLTFTLIGVCLFLHCLLAIVQSCCFDPVAMVSSVSFVVTLTHPVIYPKHRDVNLKKVLSLYN